MITVAISMFVAMTGMNTAIYPDSGSIENTANESRFSMVVAAIKPIRNLHVTYRGQTYTIREGVSTVSELTARFERLNNNLGNMGNHISPKGIVWNGRILKLGDDLSKAGIKNGDRVMILPGDKDTKAVDILAVYLFLLSSNEKVIEDAVNNVKRDQPEAFEALKDLVHFLRDGFNDVTRKDVANFLRNAFDLCYHRLRSWWEHPSLRQGLHDPDRIENYRQVVSTNLSSKFLKKISSPSSQLQKIIDSPELWRREFSKRATKAIRFGDTILEGILDLLLDVLKGSGSSHAPQNYRPYGPGTTGPAGQAPHPAGWTSQSSSSSDPTTVFTNEMEDPSLANNLLFELSDSEDDSDLDEF